jgi:hypothetical protein
VWLASGGKGQTPFAHTSGFGDYLKNVGNDALGHGIEALGEPFKLDLCKIPNVKVDLALRIGLRTGFSSADPNDPSRKPRCSFSDFTKNWLDGDAWRSKYSGQALTERFNASFDVSQTDFGIQLKTTEKINQLVQQQTEGQLLQRQEGQGYIGKTGLISNKISTPPGITKKEFEKNTPGDLQAKDEAQVRALLTSGEIRVIPNVLGIFLNTLVSTMVKNYQEKGILPFGLGCKEGGQGCFGGDAAGQFAAEGVLGNRRSAQELFSSFLTIKISTDAD